MKQREGDLSPGLAHMTHFNWFRSLDVVPFLDEDVRVGGVEVGVDLGEVGDPLEAVALAHSVVVRQAVVAAAHDVEGGEVAPRELHLESVQQSHCGSRFAFWHSNLQIEMQIGDQVIPG